MTQTCHRSFSNHVKSKHNQVVNFKCFSWQKKGFYLLSLVHSIQFLIKLIFNIGTFWSNCWCVFRVRSSDREAEDSRTVGENCSLPKETLALKMGICTHVYIDKLSPKAQRDDKSYLPLSCSFNPYNWLICLGLLKLRLTAFSGLYHIFILLFYYQKNFNFDYKNHRNIFTSF